MGTLTNYYATDTSRRSAADLINTCDTLLTQESQTIAALQALKTKIKTDIAGDVYNKTDIVEIGQLLTLKDNITTQKANYKNQLIALKALVSDAVYETEIQAEIDLL